MATNNGTSKVVKKAAKKVAKKVKKAPAAPKVKTQTDDQKAVFKLMTRANGATIKDFQEAGYVWPAQGVMKMAERNGYKTSQKKAKGELTRYFAAAK